MISRPAPKPGRVKAASRPQGLPLRRPGWRGPLLGLNNAVRSEPPLLRAYNSGQRCDGDHQRLANLGRYLLKQTWLAFVEDGHQENHLAVALFFPQLADVAFLFAVVVGRINLALVLQSQKATVGKFGHEVGIERKPPVTAALR